MWDVGAQYSDGLCGMYVYSTVMGCGMCLLKYSICALQLGIEDQGQSLGTPRPNETLRLKHESSRQSGVEVSTM